jgi:hypothetical protein
MIKVERDDVGQDRKRVVIQSLLQSIAMNLIN